MLDNVIIATVAEKMELVAVCENDELHLFNRDQFAGLIGNKATRPWGTKAHNRGRRLVLEVAEKGNQHFYVQRSVALGVPRYFVFWFPKPGTFDPLAEEWRGKTVSVADESVVPKKVIETALVRARESLTMENWQKIA